MESKIRNYTYYSFGVATMKIRVEDEKIYVTNKDLSNMEWSSNEELLTTDDVYIYPQYIPIYRMFMHSISAEKIRDNADFELLKKVTAEGENGTLSGEIWAQKVGSYPIDYVVCHDEIVAVIGVLHRKIDLLIEDGYECLTPMVDYQQEILSKPEFGEKMLGTFMIPMEDDIRLATDVYLPVALDGQEIKKFPVVLIRTCYGKTPAKDIGRFLNYGYALVLQDTRGREESEGEFSPIVDEPLDGKNTLDWIAEQEWCDGNIGMIGASYLAIVQWAAAMNNHPNLKAMISQVTGGTPTFDFPFRNGVLCSGTMAWLFAMSKKNFKPELMERDDWDEVLKTLPLRDLPSKALGEEIYCWEEWMKHEGMDEYWQRADWVAHSDKIDVPTMYISGWFDDVGAGTSEAWIMNQSNKRKNQKMILGAWKHKFNNSRDIHNIEYGIEAVRYDLFVQYIRWFDKYLKHFENGIEKESPVEYYQIGENKWKTANHWPPEKSVIQKIYLGSEGDAITSNGNGTLMMDIEDTVVYDTYVFDPEDPAPHLIDMSENECMVPENYKDMELRSDVLVYTSEPLEEDLVIAGELSANIFASTDCKDTDWVVRITEVDKEGNSLRLSDGLVRAKFRNSLKEIELLEPNEIVEYNIPMSWVANTFTKGNRIRVQVTSGAKNCIFPNHNTGEAISDDTKIIVANQKIYHSKQYPSAILLPVIK